MFLMLFNESIDNRSSAVAGSGRQCRHAAYHGRAVVAATKHSGRVSSREAVFGARDDQARVLQEQMGLSRRGEARTRTTSCS